MKHLITGGCGFLGNLIAQRLLERGEQVRALDVREDPARHPDIEFVKADICDREAVRRAMTGINVVHHNAALVPLTKSGGKFWRVNVDGSRMAAEEAVRGAVRCFVHMSSSAIFGAPKQAPVTLHTPPQPAEAYGRSKLAGENAVRQICEAAGLQCIVIRPRTILGPGRFGIFQILFDWIREGRNVYVIGSGDIAFQFAHAHDLMDAYLLAMARGKSGTYNIGADRYGTLREALENLIAHAGTASRVRSLPENLTIRTLQVLDWLHLSPLAPWHYLTYHKPFCFDVEHVLELGWRPRYSNDEMLREAYDSFCAAAGTADAPAVASPHRRRVKESILWLVKKLS